MEYTVRSTYTKTDSRLRKAADTAVILILSAAFVFVLFKFILVPSRVPAGGVSEFSGGEIVLVDRISRYFREYDLGDVLKTAAGEGGSFRRVAAKSGDLYEVRNGKAYLNGALIDESAYGGSWEGARDMSCTVPEGCLLLLPDQRGEELELEEHIVPYSGIEGEARFLIRPLKRFTMFS